MIIWSGLGILVILIVIACIFLGFMLTGQISSDPDYIQLHSWPMGVSIIVAALICWFLGRRLYASGTGRSHSLFFIPMHWWAVPLLPIGLIFCFINRTPEEVQQSKERRAARKLERVANRAADQEFKRDVKEKALTPQQ